MKTYNLVLTEHEEFGELGVAFQGELYGRDYFEPAITGRQLAHDVIEHTIIPHSCGYVDELMALGGVIAGRIENGWASLANRYLQVKDLEHDIYALVQYDHDNNLQNVPSCKHRLQDESLMSEIEQSIRKGITSALKDGYDDNSSELASHLSRYDIQSLVGWVVKGYQLWKKRFNKVDQYNVAVTMFDDISAAVDMFIKENVEGLRAKLVVNFTTGWVYLETDYDV